MALPRHTTLALAGLLLAASSLAEDPLRIGRITIRSLNVFSPEEAASGVFYRLADALHVTTRPAVVRRFLLFREGEIYEPELLAQTERNLRQLPFIKLASVVAGPPHDGVVDIDVTTQDGWTTSIGGSLGSAGGTTTYGVDLSETDLAGYGLGVALGFDKSADRRVRSIDLSDPYLFAPYWNGTLLFATTSDGYQRGLQISRPFYAFTTPWAATLAVNDFRQNDKLYDEAQLSEEFRQDHRSVTASYGLALTATDSRAQRLSAGFDSEQDSFGDLAAYPGDVLPDDRKFRYLFLEYDDVSNNFLKLNYVNKDLRYEDFNLGRTLTVRAGVSPALLGTDHTTGLLSVSASQGWQLASQSFVLGSLSYQTRWGPINSDGMLSATGFLAIKFDTSLLQTFVARLQVDRGFNLDRDVQYFADGMTGLRGYHLYAFEGDKRIIVNVEHRIFSGTEILHLVAPGAVAFVDTGTAVPAGQAIGINSFKTDAGLGLRFGIARAPAKNILRIDFAYAFNPDPLGRRGFLISFSSSQAF